VSLELGVPGFRSQDFPLLKKMEKLNPMIKSGVGKKKGCGE
jgi:hypothetical protein